MTILNPSRNIGWSSTNNIRTGFGGGTSHFQSTYAPSPSEAGSGSSADGFRCRFPPTSTTAASRGRAEIFLRTKNLGGHRQGRRHGRAVWRSGAALRRRRGRACVWTQLVSVGRLLDGSSGLDGARARAGRCLARLVPVESRTASARAPSGQGMLGTSCVPGVDRIGFQSSPFDALSRAEEPQISLRAMG